MQVIKGKHTRNGVEVKEMPMSLMTLLPPKKDACQECATDHDPKLPHNQQSLYYQMNFKMEHGRGATWIDAMAHCADEMKALWVEALKKAGVELQGG